MPFGATEIGNGRYFHNGVVYDDLDSFMKSGNASSGNATEFFDELGTGIMNAFYDLTGQTEKTSFYQAQIEREDELIKRQEDREDTALQRGVADAAAAGLSKYGMTPGAAGSAAGGSSNVHSGSNVRIDAIIDMMKAKAEIDNVQASTNKLNSEAAATTAGITRDDKYYQLAAEKQGAELIRMDLENELTKSYTAETAAKTTAIIQQEARAQASHVVDMMLKDKDLKTYDSRYIMEMMVKGSSVTLNNQYAQSQGKLREKYDAEIYKTAAEIAHLAAQDLHLSHEDEMLMIDYSKAELDLAIKQNDLDYAQKYGLPVGQILNGQAGSWTNAARSWAEQFRYKAPGFTSDANGFYNNPNGTGFVVDPVTGLVDYY